VRRQQLWWVHAEFLKKKTSQWNNFENRSPPALLRIINQAYCFWGTVLLHWLSIRQITWCDSLSFIISTLNISSLIAQVTRFVALEESRWPVYNWNIVYYINIENNIDSGQFKYRRNVIFTDSIAIYSRQWCMCVTCKRLLSRLHC